MPWIRRQLRGNAVFVRTDEQGEPITNAGRVEILYKLQPGAKVYRANLNNLEPTGDPDDEKPITPDVDPLAVPVEATSGSLPADAIIIYTDGACTGNPGPMGIGAVIMDGDERSEISEYIGRGTNNIAELTAILRALEAISDQDKKRTVVLHSDSTYSIGLLTKNWKAKKNVELVTELRELVAQFSDLRFVKVKGHSGVPENERCDELATSAIAGVI